MLRREFFAIGAAAAASAVPMEVAQAQGNPALIWGGNLSRTLDPHTVFDVPSAFTRCNLYDSLYEYAGEPPEPRPLLAAETKASADGRTFDFTLRGDVKFHDGTPMTAEDVVYSFQRMLTLRRGVAPAFTSFLKAENISATGGNVVRMVLDRAYAPFMSCLPMVAILNKRLMQANTVNNDWGEAWIAANDAGSGAYRTVPGSFRALQTLDMEAVSDYWRGWPQPESAPRPLSACARTCSRWSSSPTGATAGTTRRRGSRTRGCRGRGPRLRTRRPSGRCARCGPGRG
jgi:peptide/nickel transport system substrate-binding protein